MSAWLDKKCLETWLGSHYDDVAVTKCVVNPGSAKGDNYLSNLHRLKIVTKSGDDHHLIVKCRMEAGSAANMLEESEIYKKEQDMYDRTLPRMSALLEQALGVSEKDKPLAPKCFYASNDFIVLQDLTPRGFKMLDRREGLNLELCLQVMRALAKFHAASVAAYQEDEHSMDGYGVNAFNEPSMRDNWSRCFKGMTGTLIEELQSWPEEWTSYVHKLRHIQENILERISQTTRRRATDFNVLIHGDLWTNNILFSEQDNSLRFVDFQFVHFTSPAIDLHLFITTSAAHDVKVNHIPLLLQEYHRTLCDTLLALNYTGKLLTMDQLLAEFRKKSMYGLFAIIAPAPVMLSDPDSGFDLDVSLQYGTNPGTSMYNQQYRRAVKCMLPVLDRMGAFDDCE